MKKDILSFSKVPLIFTLLIATGFLVLPNNALAATDGSGTMTVSPNTTTPTSINNNFTFHFTNNSTDFGNSSILTLTMPSGWANPQKTTSGDAGFVTIANSTCGNSPSNGTHDISISSNIATVKIDQCDAGGIFDLQYNNLTAPMAGSYTFITKTQEGSRGLTSITNSPIITVAKTDQTITFGGLSGKTYGDSDFTTTATASSGLTVSFNSQTTDVCTASGSTVHIIAAGTCTIRALQAGNDAYNIAPNVSQSFIVSRANATIIIDGYNGVYDDNAHSATGTATGVVGESLSGLNLGSSFTNVPGGIANWIFTDITGNYNNDSGNASVVITARPITVVSDSNQGKIFGQSDPIFSYHVTAGSLAFGDSFTGALGRDAGENVGIYSITRGTLNILNDIANYFLTFLGNGFTITSADATVTLDAIDLNQTYDGSAKTVNVSANPENLSVETTYNGSASPPINAGEYEVTATSTDPNYFGADSGTLTIHKADQSITFNALDDKTYGDDFELTATTSSGLPITFDLGEDDNCTITNNTIHITSIGSCAVTAFQAGDSNYNSALDVEQEFNIIPKTLVGSVTANNKTYDGASIATIASRALLGIVGNDDVSYIGGAATFEDKEVGANKVITATLLELSGDKKSNYTVNSTATTTADITASFTISKTSLEFSTTTDTDGSLSSLTSTSTDLSLTTDGITVTATFSKDTTITATSTWDGKLNLPTITAVFTSPTADSGSTASVISAIEMGLSDTPLLFDKAVKIVFTGQTGKLIGWSQTGVFHQITDVCDSATAPTLAPSADCKIDVGSDLVVWTKHFTVFIIYTQTPNPPAGATSASSSGGGGPIGLFGAVNGNNNNVIANGGNSNNTFPTNNLLAINTSNQSSISSAEALTASASESQAETISSSVEIPTVAVAEQQNNGQETHGQSIKPQSLLAQVGSAVSFGTDNVTFGILIFVAFIALIGGETYIIIQRIQHRSF